MDIGFMVVTYFISLQPISSRITLTSLLCKMQARPISTLTKTLIKNPPIQPPSPSSRHFIEDHWTTHCKPERV